MNELRKLGQDGPIADFVENPPRGLAQVALSGVSLRIDDYWLGWFLRGPQRYHWMPYGPFPVNGQFPSQRELRMFYGLTYDFSERPPNWDSYCGGRGNPKNAHPVSVVVIVRDPLFGSIPDDWPRSVDEHPIIYEYRPEAFSFAVRSGNETKGTSNGTFGGFLWHNKDRKYFGISCAHVFGTHTPGGAPISVTAADGTSSVNVGDVVQSIFPPNNGGKCNNRLQPGLNGVDAAIVDLSAGPSIDLTIPTAGKPTQASQIASIGSGDLVTFTGATSHTVNAKVKECNIWKDINVNGISICFGDLLVLEDVTFHYVANDLSKPGDSGAWVVNTAGGVVSWDAMLVAGDGANAYCCYAENVMAALGTNLCMPP